MSVDFAGLGGDNQFVKTVASVTYFYPIWMGHILSGRAEIGAGWGWGKDPLPLFERFFLGGPNSIRSVKFREISPVDEFGNKIGGTSEVLGNIEYIVPLPFNFRVAAFFDIGNVYGFGTKFDLDRYSRSRRARHPVAVAVRADPGGLWHQPGSEEG